MDVVTLDELRDFCRVGSNLADTTLQLVGSGAEDWVSRRTGRLWTETSVEDTVAGGGNYLWLNTGPIVSVSEVATRVGGTVVSSDLYEIIGDARLAHDQGRWAGADREDYWRVKYTAGYGNTYSVPDDLKLLILEFAYRWFEQRGGEDSSGAAGRKISWRALEGTDLTQKIRDLKLGEPA